MFGYLCAYIIADAGQFVIFSGFWFVVLYSTKPLLLTPRLLPQTSLLSNAIIMVVVGRLSARFRCGITRVGREFPSTGYGTGWVAVFAT